MNAKVKVIEVSGLKIDPNADFLVVIDAARFGNVTGLDEALMRRFGNRVIVIPVMGKPSDVVKLFEIQKPINIQQEIKPIINTEGLNNGK